MDVTGRDPIRLPAEVAAAGGSFIRANRADPRELHGALGGGADLVVDCLCYTAADARRLVPLTRDVTSVVMISSRAVYVDGAGDHVNSEKVPVFDRAVTEAQPTMLPSDADPNSREGYGANKVAAEQVLLDSGQPVTVLRPSRIHGAGAKRPLEWVFVKRVLDRRPAVLLAHGGAGADHPTAAANLAALVEVVAADPGRRILNCADPDVPTAREIARTIATHLGHTWDEVLLDDADPEWLGRHPWDTRPPFILDPTAAADLGYVPVGDYAATVVEELDWLVAGATGVGERGGARLPAGLDEEFFAASFDYAAEDVFRAGCAAR